MGFPQMLTAFDFALGPAREIVLAGDASAQDFKTMKELLFSRFAPRDVWIHHPPGKEGERIEALAEFVRRQTPLKGKTAAYICQNHVCALPVTEAGELRKLL